MKKIITLFLSLLILISGNAQSIAESATESQPVVFSSKGPYKAGDVITLSIFIRTKFKLVGEPEIELSPGWPVTWRFSRASEASSLGYFRHLNFYYGPIRFGNTLPTYDPEFYSYKIVENPNGSFDYTIRSSMLVMNNYKETEFKWMRINYSDEARQSFKSELSLSNFGVQAQKISGERVVPTGFIWKQKDDVLPILPASIVLTENRKSLDLPRLTANGTPIHYSLLNSGSNCSLGGFRFPGDSASLLTFSNLNSSCSIDVFTLEDETYKPIKGTFTIFGEDQADIERKQAEREQKYRADQVITYSPSISKSVSLSAQGIPIALTATSGLPVFAYNSTTYSCEFKNNLIVTKAPGRCVIAFSQEGDSRFKPAETLILDFLITSGPQKKTIVCLKGSSVKKVTSINPKCPSGYKVKK